MRSLLIGAVLSLHFIYANQNDSVGDQKSTFEQAHSYYQAKNWEEALKAYNDVVSENPYHGGHWYRLGEIHYHLKNYEESTRAYHMSVELGYNFPNGHPMYDIGRNYALQNQPQEAVKWLEKAIQSNLDLLPEVEKDPELDNIRNDSRFLAMVTPKLPEDVSRNEGWRADLQYMAARLEKAHVNLFHKMSQEEWNAAVENLNRRIPKLEDYQIIVEMMRLVAMVGDSHTHIEPPLQSRFQFHLIPVMFYQFKEGVFIRGATSAYKHAVGSQVLSVGKMSVKETFDRLKDIISRDNDMGIRSLAPVWLSVPEILHALNITDTFNEVEVQSENRGGETSTIIFKSEPMSLPVAMTLVGRGTVPNWIAANDNADRPPPLWLKNPSDIFWFEYLKDEKLVYFQFNQVRNKPDETFADFCKRMFDFINPNDVEALIIDIRMNSGGNLFLNKALIHELIQCEKINQKGKLFTIIGRRTGSAAKSLAVDLETHTQTLFVGEPTAGKPNNYSEYTPFTLPYSGLIVSASTLYWQHSVPYDYRTWIAPDIVTELTSKDYKSNIDPALNAILDYLGKSH